MEPMEASSSSYCQQHGLHAYVQDAAQLYATRQLPARHNAARTADDAQAAAAASLAEYFTSVACGEHVLWRHWAYISATHANRQAFLVVAQRALAPLTASAGRLGLGDVTSLLQLLCPDLPASVVKNAWSSAEAIQQWLDLQQQEQQPAEAAAAPAAQEGDGDGSDAAMLVRLPVFRQCFEVTFMFEVHLLALRKGAFDANKRCVSLQQLESVMQDAAENLPPQGWPVLPERCLRQAVAQASRAATYPDFAFRELVRALCCCEPLVRDVRQQLREYAAGAAAAAAAVVCPSGSRRSSGSDDL